MAAILALRRSRWLTNRVGASLYASVTGCERDFSPYSSGAAEVIAPKHTLDHDSLRDQTLLSRQMITLEPKKGSELTFRPSPASNMCQTFAYGYSMFYKDLTISFDIMKRSLKRLTEELPLLAGRYKPAKRAPGIKTFVENELELSGEGVEFTTSHTEDHTIEDLGPATWTDGFHNHTLTSFGVPFYAEGLDMAALAKGKEPLFKLKVTRCADGSIISLTVAHVLADGGRAVRIAQRLAQIYTAELNKVRGLTTDTVLPPPLRFGPELETPEGFTAALKEGSVPNNILPPAPEYKMTMTQWLSAPYRLYKHGTSKYDVQMLHLPKHAAKELKRIASGGELPGGERISTLDAIQAFIATLVCSLRGLPLVPTSPNEMTVNVDLLHKDMPFAKPEALERHLGNAVHICHVKGVKPGTAIPSYDSREDSDDKIAAAFTTALQTNARLIRSAISSFRADIGNVIQALQWQDILASLPEGRTGAAFIVKAADTKCASTSAVASFSNYDSIDFGSGPPTYFQINHLPRFDWWTIVQSGTAIGSDGIVCSMTLAHGLQTKLVTHPVWRVLMPQARLIVADPVAEDVRRRMEQKCLEENRRGNDAAEKFTDNTTKNDGGKRVVDTSFQNEKNSMNIGIATAQQQQPHSFLKDLRQSYRASSTSHKHIF